MSIPIKLCSREREIQIRTLTIHKVRSVKVNCLRGNIHLKNNFIIY